MVTFNELEKCRLEYLDKHKKYMRIVSIPTLVICVMVLSISIFSKNFFLIPFLFIPPIMAYVIVTIPTYKLLLKYREMYKKFFVEKNLLETFSNLSYDSSRGLDREVLKATELINTGDSYHSNDLITGKYKDVAFSQSDVHILVEHTDSDGNTSYTTIFKGRFMIFEFPKKFSFRLVVSAKHFGCISMRRKLKSINTESTEFNKNFNIYTEDDFEAFYILDPAFMERIQKIYSTYNCPVSFFFVDNKLVVGLSDLKDAFEPPHPSKSIDENSENDKIKAEIKVITDFVDDLKLDNKLFK